MALCAKELHKPVYVVAESFKFTKIYPLNQEDIPNEFKVGLHHFVALFVPAWARQYSRYF